MRRGAWFAILVTAMCAGYGWAATFTVEITPTSSTTVGPGGSVTYDVTGVVSAAGNVGLAIFGVDVETNTGIAQPQASAGASMGAFVKNLGITNPAGYGGTVAGDDLLQIGGGQNTIGNDAVPPHPAYPSGVVVQGIGLGSSVVVAQGSITAPGTPGQYQVSLTHPFGSVLLANMGTYWSVEAATASVGASGGFAITVTAGLPQLVSSDPPADGTLAKTQNNVILLTFDSAITLPGGPALSIVNLHTSVDVSGSFTYSIEPDGVTLKAKENGAVLTNKNWHRVTPGAGFNVQAFVRDLCTLQGDADGNKQVTALDYFPVKNHPFEMTDKRYDLDGNGQVTALDYFVVKNHPFDAPPAKP